MIACAPPWRRVRNALKSTVLVFRPVKGRTARQRRSWAVPPCCSLAALAGWGGQATNGCASLLLSLVGDRIWVHAITALRRGGACQADAGPVPRSGISVRRVRAAPPPDDLKIDSPHLGRNDGEKSGR